MTHAEAIAITNDDVMCAVWDRDEFTASAITDTGGWNYAIELGIVRDEKAYILITDAEGGLATCAEERTGWMVGYYGPENGWSAETENDLLVIEGHTCPEAAVSLALLLVNGPLQDAA